jgi:hypothetical protein
VYKPLKYSAAVVVPFLNAVKGLFNVAPPTLAVKYHIPSVNDAELLITSDNEEYAQKAAEILQRVYKSIQYGLPQYAPEGDSIEGVSYWSYGTRFVVSFLATVSSSIGRIPISSM